MASSSALTATAAPTATTKMSAKAPKTKLVSLRLGAQLLSKFPHESPSQPASTSKSSSSSTSTPAAIPTEPSPSANPSESTPGPVTNEATPSATAGNTLAPPAQPAKRKGIPGPKPGSKRPAGAAGIDGVPKPRGKPGPKKKPRIGEIMNGDVKTSFAPPPAKMNPKANQGAINANLRALDRTGKPCRKWQRKSFSIKSFTGVSWDAPSWAARANGPSFDANGEIRSDSSSSDNIKMNGNSSALPSEKSNSAVDMDTPSLAPIVESSPPVATPV